MDRKGMSWRWEGHGARAGGGSGRDERKRAKDNVTYVKMP